MIALLMDCPVCDAPLRIPILSEIVDATTMRVEPDGEYLRAHYLTHRPYDGLPVAA